MTKGRAPVKMDSRKASRHASGRIVGDELVQQAVKDYIENEILPQYDTENGHGLDHIENVMRRSLDFAKRINGGEIATTEADFANLPAELATGKVSYDMCYTVAAFHDLGRLKDNKLHHLISAARLIDDDFVTANFTRDQLRVMADAVMDHRASNQLDPITIYGRIVSSADRDTDCYYMLRRTYNYMRHKHPEANEDEIMSYAYDKIMKKFVAEDAYGAKKMYFKNPAFEAAVAKFHEMTKSPEIFRQEVVKALAETGDLARAEG